MKDKMMDIYTNPGSRELLTVVETVAREKAIEKEKASLLKEENKAKTVKAAKTKKKE